MKHTYHVRLKVTKTHPKRAIKALLAGFPAARVYLSDDLGASAKSEDERQMRALYAAAKNRGFTCSLDVRTEYGHDDALSGELGILSFDAKAEGKLPKDAFDFSTGCPRCGLGAAQVKPHVLSGRAIRYKGNFLHGHRGSHGVLMRAEIARAIIDATGQPWCMRHPVTRAGKPVEEWMEAVPCATMPPLSPKSEGVSFGSTTANGSTGDPPEVVPPCPVCGRIIWDASREYPTRLVYSRAAIEAAQRHAVVAMYEPWVCFPGFDPIKRTFEHLYGLPWLLFNREAIKVLLKYTQTEHIETASYIQPVFSE